MEGSGLALGGFAPREMTEEQKADYEHRKENAAVIEAGMMVGIRELSGRLERGAADMSTKEVTEIVAALGASASMLALLGAYAAPPFGAV
ncbi:MAG: hypothetical protein J6M10_10390 [Clostridia bacterium]|nr:hypothetical protein [Clostridia bacterium]